MGGWWQRLTPRIAQSVVTAIVRTATKQLHAVDTMLTKQLLGAARRLLEWTSEPDVLREQGHKLERACDRVLSLESQLHREKQHAQELPSLELAHLRDAAANERAALQKCLESVEQRLATAEAELSTTRRKAGLA